MLGYKIYKFILKPLTGFGTPLKGDTLFGHLCWQFFYDKTLLGKSLEELLEDYKSSPFIIVSSAFPYHEGKIYLKRPSLPLNYLFSLSEEELVQRRKELKRKNYFLYQAPLKPVKQIEYFEERFVEEDEQVHCSIHRIYGKTVTAPFGPFAVPKLWYLTELIVFIAIREDLSVEGVKEALLRIGKIGFGRDASAGWGKFEVSDEISAVDFYSPESSFNAYYTLSPSVPERNSERKYKKIFYEPFVRFGKLGDILSFASNPFKAPVLMADEGAIYIPENPEKRIYLGRAIKEISKVKENAVCQGYSLVIPMEVSYEA